MYIRLTKLDNTPIWLNASFIVTVEPRRQGGSIVVPIGDGLDYDVREAPETILSLLDGAPVPAVVPVPAPKGLAKQPEDVSDEPITMTAADVVELKDDSGPAPVSAPVATPEVAAEAPSGKRKSARKPAVRKSRAKKSDSVVSDELVERLRKLAPGSVRKLANTLTTQFKVTDAEGTIKALAEKGVLSLDRDHVSWQ